MLLNKIEIKAIVESQQEGLTYLENYDAGILPAIKERPDIVDLVFLDTETVEALHAELGLQNDLRDRGLLESALARAAQAAAYANPSLHEMAMLIAEGIIRNHPFADGNKRTAQLALCSFLTLNNQPCPENAVKTSEILLDMTTRKLSVEEAGTYLSLCRQKYIELHPAQKTSSGPK